MVTSDPDQYMGTRNTIQHGATRTVCAAYAGRAVVSAVPDSVRVDMQRMLQRLEDRRCVLFRGGYGPEGGAGEGGERRREMDGRSYGVCGGFEGDEKYRLVSQW